MSDGAGDRELETIGELTSNLQKQLYMIKCTALFGNRVMTWWDFKKESTPADLLLHSLSSLRHQLAQVFE